MKRAFDCLLVASEFCGDFLLSRTKKEVLPRLVEFLNRRLNTRWYYYQQHHRVNTIKSIEYYAELKLLGSIGQLVCNLKIPSKDISQIADVLILYLCFKGVSRELQQCAFDSLTTLCLDSHLSLVLHLIHRVKKLYYFNEDDTGSGCCIGCDCRPTETSTKFTEHLLPLSATMLNNAFH